MIAAIIPAAGRSARMGRPKLILPIEGMSVIARVVAALRHGGADPVVVVAPPAEIPGSAALAKAATGAGASVLIADAPPPDMRASVQIGLDHLDRGPAPDAFLLAPGDSPGLSPALVARVIEGAQDHPATILVPVWAGRRGHPVLIPWHLAQTIRALPPHVGINALLAQHADSVVPIDAPDPGALADLDTPEDYQKWKSEFVTEVTEDTEGEFSQESESS